MRMIKPEWSGEAQARCGTIIEHLIKRDYARAVKLLRKAKDVCEKSGDPTAAHVLNAAYRVCLACKQSREEADWHGRAYTEVLDREQELRRELQEILDSIVTTGPSNLSLKDEGLPDNSDPVGNEQKQLKPLSAESQGLWGRIQNLLYAAGHARGEDSKEKLLTSTIADAIHETEYFGGTPGAEPAGAESESTVREAPHSLAVCCLGPFQVFLNDRLVADWRNGKAKSVFKYLIVHHDRPVSKEILMDLFWPDANPDHARNSLNVAIYHIRQTLSSAPTFSYVLFQDNCYLLNPELAIWVDSESFSEHMALARAMEQHGNQEAAIREYCAADALYGGGFLEEDRYEEWMTPIRQALENDYFSLLDSLSHHYFERKDYEGCVRTCNKLLALDACQEEAHRRIMRCYWRQNQRNLAMRQYHQCVKALKRVLGVAPSPLTVELNRRIQDRIRD